MAASSKPLWYTVEDKNESKGKTPCWPKWLPFSPLEVVNFIGVMYTCLVIVVLLSANAWVTCPALYGAEQCETPILLGYLMVFNILANLFCFHYYKRHNRIQHWFPGNLRDDGLEAEYTKYCYTCDLVVPKRCHHCPLCNYCVLRKDHHCFLVGGCVGFGNHRYFVGFLFWAAIGTFYGTSFMWTYLNKFYEPFFPWGWIDWLVPVGINRWLIETRLEVFRQFISLYSPRLP